LAVALSHSLGLSLLLDGFHGLLHGFLVAYVITFYRLQVFIQLIHQGNSCRDIQTDDFLIGEFIEMLDEGPETVPVGGDDHTLSFEDCRSDGIFPIREKAFNSILEALSQRKKILGEVCVAPIPARITFIILREQWRADIIASAPEKDFFLPLFLGCLRLIQTLQSPIVTLVQPPGPIDRDPHHIEFIEGQPQRPYSPFQHRGVGDVEHIAFFSENFPRLYGFVDALFIQVHIGPPRKKVLFIPNALSMAEQNDFIHYKLL
jgi:hypothetical protein